MRCGPYITAAAAPVMAVAQLLMLATSPGAGAGKQVPVQVLSSITSSSANEPSAPGTRRRYSTREDGRRPAAAAATRGLPRY